MPNLLHSLRASRITPDRFLACIEIPAHSRCKYEYDEEAGALRLDRILYTSTQYPHNYGFIPKTWALDDDPLDVLVMASESIVPLALLTCKPIGLLQMTDQGKIDEKIIAVCVNDPVFESYNDISDLPKHLFEEIHHFFRVYKELEVGKPTQVEGILGAEEAKKAIAEAKARYAKKFPNEK